MPRVVRVTLSVAAPLFRAVERERRARRAPRSAVVNEALETWIRERARAEKIRRYVRAYRRHPADASDEAAREAWTGAETWRDRWK